MEIYPLPLIARGTDAVRAIQYSWLADTSPHRLGSQDLIECWRFSSQEPIAVRQRLHKPLQHLLQIEQGANEHPSLCTDFLALKKILVSIE
jgi:hypothetical protein